MLNAITIYECSFFFLLPIPILNAVKNVNLLLFANCQTQLHIFRWRCDTIVFVITNFQIIHSVISIFIIANLVTSAECRLVLNYLWWGCAFIFLNVHCHWCWHKIITTRKHCNEQFFFFRFVAGKNNIMFFFLEDSQFAAHKIVNGRIYVLCHFAQHTRDSSG